MSQDLGSSQLRNSQGNLFLKSDMLSKLMRVLNPIRGESKAWGLRQIC